MSRLFTRVRKNSAGSTFERNRFNFIEGTGVTLTITDDPTDQEIDITIASSGGVSFATPAIALGSAAAAGSASTAIRSDSTIAAFDTTAPVTQAIGDAAAVGVINFAARRDHVHGMPGFGSPVASAVGDTSANGSATTLARSDHRHARESFVTNTIALGSAAAAGSATTLIRSDATIQAFDGTVPTTSSPGDAAATGSVNFAARRDHVHGREQTPAKVAVQYATAAALSAFTASGSTLTATANGPLVVDGATTSVGDRILVRLQIDLGTAPGSSGDPRFNGIYTVTQVGAVGASPWILDRAPDANTSAEVDAGLLVYVQKGATLAGRIFKQIVPGPTIDTDALLFVGIKDWAFQVVISYATAAVLPNSPTYSGGVLTAGANAALIVDGSAVSLNQFILVKNQATGSQNGLYRVTAVGSGAAPWTLTRVSGYNSTAEIRAPWVFRPLLGATNAGLAFFQTAANPVLDTTALVYAATGTSSEPTVQVFTANGTWTAPPGCTRIIVEVVGGGGGGGGAAGVAAQAAGAGGGGGGGYVRRMFDISADGAPISGTVTVGTGGAGGPGATPAVGGNGNTSSFAHGGTTIQATGGSGGGAAAAGTTAARGGAGGAAGVGSGGDVNGAGQGGQHGARFSGTSAYGGAGGSSGLGTGGAPSTSEGAAGAVSGAYGGGGAGGASNSATARDGGAGANGVVIVTEFY